MRTSLTYLSRHFARHRRFVYVWPWSREEHPKEQPKVVLETTRGKALPLLIIHTIPLLTSLVIILINFLGFFIGEDFQGPIKSETINLLGLQIAAKVNEILIVASLGLIVLHAVRYQLLFGQGLPLGLVGSGLSFSSFQMFFQKEFWKSVLFLFGHGEKLSRCLFVLLLVASTLTATLAGPASATMLVPQSRSWPSGATDIFLEGKQEQYWPSEVSARDDTLQRLCKGENATSLAICPAAGYHALWQRWGRLNYTNLYEASIQSYAKELSGSRTYWPTTSPGSLLPPLYTLGNLRQGTSDSWFVQPHAAAATLLERTTSDWWQALTSHKDRSPSKIDDRAVSAQVASPIVNTRCGAPQNLTADDKTVQFPTILGRFGFAQNEPFNVDSLLTSPVDTVRLHWIHLPDAFGASSIAAVFEGPWTEDNSSRVVVGCSAQSGWVPTYVQMDKYAFWSGWYPWNITFSERKPAWADPGPGNPIAPTNGRIKINEDFLEMLTPTIPGENITTIESILMAAGLSRYSSSPSMSDQWAQSNKPSQGRSALLESIICNVIVDGLSRYGVQHIFDTRGDPTQWTLQSYNPRPDFQKRLLSSQTAFVQPDLPVSDYNTIPVAMSISGFSYRAELATRLSLAVLLFHAVMAIAHIAYVLINPETSRSWSSVSELIALAHNSRPAPHALLNTGAGIQYSETYSQMAKIRVRTRSDEPEAGRVELVFGDSEEYSHVRKPSQQSLVTLPAEADVEAQRGRSPAPSVSSISRARHSATWPVHSSKLSLQADDIGIESRSESVAPLVPITVKIPEEAHLDEAEELRKVVGGRKYG